LVNRKGFSIHHVAKSARFHPAAFIFSERQRRMVNRWYAAPGSTHRSDCAVNLTLNRLGLKREE
jgi:hypothetical protein